MAVRTEDAPAGDWKKTEPSVSASRPSRRAQMSAPLWCRSRTRGQARRSQWSRSGRSSSRIRPNKRRNLGAGAGNASHFRVFDDARPPKCAKLLTAGLCGRAEDRKARSPRFDSLCSQRIDHASSANRASIGAWRTGGGLEGVEHMLSWSAGHLQWRPKFTCEMLSLQLELRSHHSTSAPRPRQTKLPHSVLTRRGSVEIVAGIQLVRGRGHRPLM